MKPEIVEKYKRAGNLAGRARDHGASLIDAGVKLLDVATAVEEMIRKEGAAPAFPCCISLNADAAHYSPAVNDPLTFSKGDLVKIDVGVHVDGFIGDTARTVEVGSSQNGPLLEASQQALANALNTARPGGPIREVSAAIEQTVRGFGFKPVVNLTGHSVDEYVQHAGLSVPNVAATAHGNFPRSGAVAIEPFASAGAGKVSDGAGGHIYHFQAPRPQRDPHAKAALKYIQEHHGDLPFSERWVEGAIPASRVPYAMRLLARSGAVRHYPILKDAGGGMVTQHEHTVLFLEDEIVVTTKV